MWLGGYHYYGLLVFSPYIDTMITGFWSGDSVLVDVLFLDFSWPRKPSPWNELNLR